MTRAGNSLRKILAVAAVSALVPVGAAHAGFKVLYAFRGGSDGAHPRAVLLLKNGTLYGTTEYGGASNAGTAFEIAADGTESVLHSFGSGSDGSAPQTGLVADDAGNLYGTTPSGGPAAYGTVFRIAPDGTEILLHSFPSFEGDGAEPNQMIIDKDGNLYGTCFGIGAHGYGTVFELAADGTLTTLHSFNYTDGAGPLAGLLRTRKGALYGTALYGGSGGYGTLFRLAAGGSMKTLHNFTGGSDGFSPDANVIRDSTGNLYASLTEANSIFEITANGVTQLLTFTDSADGSFPNGDLVLDSGGNIYGTAINGGNGSGYGTVFALSAGGSLSALHTFTGGKDGMYPGAGLIADKKGRLYGTTYAGGAAGYGTVFRLDSFIVESPEEK
jgi:uncharacterized repeat protein (TIGR03803 family)